MHRPTIGLDLGAAYSKVAFRPPFPPQRVNHYVQRDSDVVTFGGSALLPSVVLKTTRAHDPWICGPEAMRLTPGAGWRTYRNWKSDLFLPSGTPAAELHEVMTAFFRYLNNRLQDADCGPGPTTLTRVSLPAFPDVSPAAAAIRGSLKAAGWEGEVETVEEPRANVIGTFAAGRNFVSAAGEISYGPMFGSQQVIGDAYLPALFRAIREFSFGRRRARHMRVVVVDCGGYTLDIANLVIDLKVIEQTTFPESRPATASAAIGITNQLDGICIDHLLEKHGINVQTLAFRALEVAKRDIYSGKPHQVIHEGRVVEIGGVSEQAFIKDMQGRYCDMVWGEIEKNDTVPEVAVLTGGGVEITRVRKTLERRLKERGVQHVHISHGVWTFDRDDLEVERVKPAVAVEGLGRTATALGASCIALGFIRDKAADKYTPRGVWW